MTLQLVRLDDVPSTPWRNGGGETRALLTWPGTEAWALRFSVAKVAQDGPFSAYPGVQRWFAVVEGGGVLLTFGADRTQRCTPATPPLVFDGAQAPGCRLIDGATQDLNLMVRADAGAGALQRAARPLAPCAFRAVYCADAATLHRGDAPAEPLPPGSLAWSAEPGDQTMWTIAQHQLAAGARCWWLTFAPVPGRSRDAGSATTDHPTP